MYPILLQLGPITIYSYGAMMAIAFLTAGYLVAQEMDRRGYDGEIASRMVVWAAVGGLAGARIWSIADDWHGFLQSPLRTMLSGAGFVWYGGLVGGFLAVSWWIRRARLPWAVTVDCIAPALALGHGIGRIGCELAGDGDWGTPSTLPWAHAYPNAIIGWQEWTAASGYPVDVRVHPTPIYETLAYGAVFAILWSVRKRPMAPGGLFWLYLVLASVCRFVIEFVRVNPPALWGLSEAQIFSVILVGIGAWRLRAAVRSPAAASPATARRAAKS